MDLVYELIKKVDVWFRGVFLWNCLFLDLLGGGIGDVVIGVFLVSLICFVIFFG